MLRSTYLKAGALALSSFLLFGCNEQSSHADLHHYIARVKNRPAEKIEPLPRIEHYVDYRYQVAGRRDPFTPPRKLASKAEKPGSDRKKQLLEKFPLDSLRMVGTLKKGKRVWAIIVAPDGKAHHVGVGNYLGQNEGKIVKIAPDRLLLREVVLGVDGTWKKRDASLAVG